MKNFLYIFTILLNIICAYDYDWMEEVYAERKDFFLGKDSLYKYLDKSTLPIIEPELKSIYNNTLKKNNGTKKYSKLNYVKRMEEREKSFNERSQKAHIKRLINDKDPLIKTLFIDKLGLDVNVVNSLTTEKREDLYFKIVRHSVGNSLWIVSEESMPEEWRKIGIPFADDDWQKKKSGHKYAKITHSELGIIYAMGLEILDDAVVFTKDLCRRNSSVCKEWRRIPKAEIYYYSFDLIDSGSIIKIKTPKKEIKKRSSEHKLFKKRVKWKLVYSKD